MGLILERCNHDQLMMLYRFVSEALFFVTNSTVLKACFNRIGEFSGTTDFLLQIAEKQGKVKKGGVLDLQKAARTVLEGPIQFNFNSIFNSISIQFQFNLMSYL